MNDINEKISLKLDLILTYMENLDKRLQVLENQNNSTFQKINEIEEKTNDVHHFVPFVQYLENLGQKLVNLSFLPTLTYFNKSSIIDPKLLTE